MWGIIYQQCGIYVLSRIIYASNTNDADTALNLQLNFIDGYAKNSSHTVGVYNVYKVLKSESRLNIAQGEKY